MVKETENIITKNWNAKATSYKNKEIKSRGNKNVL